MKTVLITGGTGLVGRHLSKRLQEKGYHVSILSRKKKKDSRIPTYIWNLTQNEIQEEAIEKANYIIHLAGANIGDKRWTLRRKRIIIDSRVQSGELLLDKIKERNIDIESFISASAIGYYGAETSEKIFTENDPPANDYLGETCKKWEEATDKFKDLGIRSVKIRTGVVLTSKGGALSKMVIPVKMGIGSPIGTGEQYLPWIHINDLCNIYIKAIEDKTMDGAYNGVAPEEIQNKEFVRTLARLLKKPFWFPNVPSIMMKLIFGEMSDMLLKGSRVSANKIKNRGYNFQFPNLESALRDLLKKK